MLRLALALGVGLIVGVERGWRQREEPDGGRTAGVRTFTLIGLFGGLCGALSAPTRSAAPWLAGLVLLSLVFAAFSYRQARAERDFSVTNVVAAMLVFVLGVLAVTGDMRAAAAGAVVSAGVLASRESLHRLVAGLSWIELRSALLLLAMTVVILPLLPNRAVDPLGALNPRELWLLTTLIAAVSFCGYVALKVAGPDKGLPIAGLAGGLASSTATTVALARRSRLGDDADGLGSAVALAAMVSVIRASALATVVQPSLGPRLAFPAGAVALVFGLAGIWPLLRRKASRSGAAAQIGLPFELGAVLMFGALLAAVTFAGAWVTRYAGDGGGYLFAAVSGLMDVDAITLTLARAAGHGADASFAAAAILVALAANAAQRAIFAWSFGSRRFAVRFTAVSGAAVMAGGAALATMRLVG